MISYRYGNVFLQLTRTAEMSFVQERDPFGVDSMYTVYTIRVKGFLATSEGLFPGVGGQTAITAVTLNAVKAELETPRRPMTYAIAGQTIVSVPSGSIDAKIGPEPLPCRITEVTTGTFMVECGCIVRVVDCVDVCEGGNNPILSLRWTQTESFDENWYSNLTTDGHLIVRSDLLQSADNFRPLATPPLLVDYIRTESRYTLSPDGLTLNFHFNDVERDRLPPFPATKARGTYTVETPQPGFNRFGTVTLRLEGQKGTSRKALLIKAVAMAYSKLKSDQFLAPGPPIIWGRFTEDLFEPAIDLSMTARMTPIQKKGFAEAKSATTAALQVAGAFIPGVGSLTGFELGAKLGGGGGLAGAIVAAAGAAGVGGGALTGPAGAPVAIAGGADVEASQFTALVMPSVGKEMEGLKSGQPGIAPPDRKRLAGLLTAMFRDPCLCLETDAELRTTSDPPTNDRNSGMVDTAELKTNPSPFSGNIESIITIGATSIIEGVLESSGWLVDAAPYDTYQIEVATTMITGALQMPGTGVGHDASISAVVTGHGGMMQKVTTWVAGRTGKPPQLPAFESPDPNVVPLYSSIVAKDVVPNADGSAPVYLIAGYYVHAIINPALNQITPPVAPMYDAEVHTAAADGASFWTETPLWSAANGVVGGLVATTNANPFVPDGVSTTPQPQASPGFDLSNLTSQELNSIIQTGSANPGQIPTPDYFYNPPIRP